jgi:hypothetical protein
MSRAAEQSSQPQQSSSHPLPSNAEPSILKTIRKLPKIIGLDGVYEFYKGNNMITNSVFPVKKPPGEWTAEERNECFKSRGDSIDKKAFTKWLDEKLVVGRKLDEFIIEKGVEGGKAAYTDYVGEDKVNCMMKSAQTIKRKESGRGEDEKHDVGRGSVSAKRKLQELKDNTVTEHVAKKVRGRPPKGAS